MRTRDDIYDTLYNRHSYEWQVQGFGMIRTYLEPWEGESEPRLQVWDQRLATWGNNAIHDHPWSFQSVIYAGTLFNQRFSVKEAKGDAALNGNGHMTQIKPGERGGRLSENPVLPCLIVPNVPEIYQMGETYGQTHREMHLTGYLPGTVTLITRHGREPQDIANIAWYGKPEDQPPFVNPRPATAQEVEMVIQRCLATWWMSGPTPPSNDEVIANKMFGLDVGLRKYCNHGPDSFTPGCRHDPNNSRG